MIVYAPAQIISAPAQLITAPAQLITAPAQPPATGVVVYTALLQFFSVLDHSAVAKKGRMRRAREAKSEKKKHREKQRMRKYENKT